LEKGSVFGGQQQRHSVQAGFFHGVVRSWVSFAVGTLLSPFIIIQLRVIAAQIGW
jgi:hypothetical protein